MLDPTAKLVKNLYNLIIFCAFLYLISVCHYDMNFEKTESNCFVIHSGKSKFR